MKTIGRTILATLASAAIAVPPALMSGATASAADAKPAAAKPPAKKGGAAPAGAMDEQAMMKKMMEAAMPGPMHDRLKSAVGHWDLTVTTWMAPGTPPQTNKGTADRKMILGDRYLQEEAHGEAMAPGMPPFEGTGATGYDNVSKKFVSTWMDNMGTGIMNSTGTYDEKTKSFTHHGTFNDPMTGKAKTIRMVMKMMDDTHQTVEFFDKTPAGKEFKSMEIQYVKK